MWKILKERQFIFVFDIKNELNIKLADIIINLLNGKITYNEMCEKICEIRPDIKLDETFLKNENIGNIKDFLLYSFALLKDNLLSENFNAVYDIADMIQGLPEFKHLKNKSKMKRY
ncbi:MAG: hypothetical protein II931_00675 [Clostridia bacterium]|nr:hypothetical protein [Clostridia bacterium]